MLPSIHNLALALFLLTVPLQIYGQIGKDLMSNYVSNCILKTGIWGDLGYFLQSFLQNMYVVLSGMDGNILYISCVQRLH